jgi:hypothetical protein
MSSADTMIHRTRRAVAAAGLAMALALTLAACPPQETPPDALPGEPSPDDPAPVSGITLEQRCNNREYGFQVSYPAGWAVNPPNGLPACSAFDPDDAGMPAVGEIPRDIAIVIHRHRVPLHRTTDFDADPTVHAVSRDETTVDGRRAVVAELQHTGQGMYPQGGRQYGYYVDVAGSTLLATTHGIDAADPPSYQERQRILDDMMASLRFQDGP